MTEEQRKAALDFDWFRDPEHPPIQAWTHRGILCAVSDSGLGFINGYVRIPESHPWRQIEDYDQFPVDVHGGLTFGPKPGHEQRTYPEIPAIEGEPVTLPAWPGYSWQDVHGWVGFDTGHAWDWWPEEELVAAGVVLTENARSIRAITEAHPDRFTRVWTIEDMIAEVQHLADQVKEAE